MQLGLVALLAVRRCCRRASPRRRSISRPIAQEARARAGGRRQHADGDRVHEAQQPCAGARSHRARARRSAGESERAGDRRPGVRDAQRNAEGATARSRPRRVSASRIPPSRTATRGFCAGRGKAAGRREIVPRGRAQSALPNSGSGAAQRRCLRGRRGRRASMRSAISTARWRSSPTCRRPCWSSATSPSSRGDSKQALDYVQRYLAVNPPTRKCSGSASARSASSATTPRPPRFGRSISPNSRDSEQARCCAPALIDERRPRKRSGQRAESRTRAARNEHAKDRRRHASRRVGHRGARGRRLSAHRPRGVREGTPEEIREPPGRIGGG